MFTNTKHVTFAAFYKSVYFFPTTERNIELKQGYINYPL